MEMCNQSKNREYTTHFVCGKCGAEVFDLPKCICGFKFSLGKPTDKEELKNYIYGEGCERKQESQEIH